MQKFLVALVVSALLCLEAFAGSASGCEQEIVLKFYPPEGERAAVVTVCNGGLAAYYNTDVDRLMGIVPKIDTQTGWVELQIFPIEWVDFKGYRITGPKTENTMVPVSHSTTFDRLAIEVTEIRPASSEDSLYQGCGVTCGGETAYGITVVMPCGSCSR